MPIPGPRPAKAPRRRRPKTAPRVHLMAPQGLGISPAAWGRREVEIVYAEVARGHGAHPGSGRAGRADRAGLGAASRHAGSHGRRLPTPRGVRPSRVRAAASVAVRLWLADMETRSGSSGGRAGPRPRLA